MCIRDSYATPNPVTYVAVTDAQPEARREIVDNALCNNCHFKLQAHGGNRNNPQYCTFCHNPNQPGDERIERFEGKTVEASSLDMRHFIHRIHTGEELAIQPYILGGNPTPTKANPAGTPVDCDDKNDCTVDICEPSTGCMHASSSSGSPCDDGDPCTTPDTCDGNGACVPGAGGCGGALHPRGGPFRGDRDAPRGQHRRGVPRAGRPRAGRRRR